MRNKKELRDLIADGQLEDAAISALTYAEATTDIESINGLQSLQSDLSIHKSLWTSGQISFEEYARTQARISSGLLGRINELPDEPTIQAVKKRIREDNFKWFVFYLFIVAKLIVFAWAAFMWRTKGFLNEETFSILNVLMPGTVLNISIMFTSLFNSSTEGNQPRRYVLLRFKYLIIWAFTFYLFVQIFLITNKVNGSLSFELVITGFAAVETIIGLLMSDLTGQIFKRMYSDSKLLLIL